MAISSARRPMPVQRMQCVSRAGPRRICVARSPSPTFISTLSSVISSPSNSSSQCPPCSSGPMIGMRRMMRQPGWSAWNRKAVRPLRSSSPVRAMRMKCFADLGAGDVVLAAVDAPAVADALGPRIGHGRVAAAAIGLGHGEGALHRAVDDGLQPALLLRLGPHHVQQRACCRRPAPRRGRPRGRRWSGSSPRSRRRGRPWSGRRRRAPAACRAPRGPSAFTSARSVSSSGVAMFSCSS